MEEVPVPPTPVVPAPEPLVQPPAPTTVTPNSRSNTKIIILGIALVVLAVVVVAINLLLRIASKKVFIDTIAPLASQSPIPSTIPTSTQPDLPLLLLTFPGLNVKI